MQTKNILALILITLGVLCRVYQPIYNFAPVVAIALFSGFVFKNRMFAISIAILSSLIGDAIIAYTNNYSFLHSTIVFVYGAYFMIVILGEKIQKSTYPILSIATFGVVASLVFFVTTNLGVWLMDNMYPKNSTGLIECFVLAIPFYKYSFVSDLIYIPIIFGTYALVTQPNIVKIKTN